MVLKRRQMQSGSALFGFFAASDAQLSPYLNGLPMSERQAISSTLDAALQAPNEQFFTNRLADLLRAYFQASEGSEEELRLRAITRMLGLVLQDRYRRDAAVLWELVWTQTMEDEPEPPVEPDIFEMARDQLKLMLRETGLPEDWMARAESAHWAADLLAFDLVQSDSVDALCRELRRIKWQNDLAAATRAVCGLSWNFAFDGSVFSAPVDNDHLWLQTVSLGLAPRQDLKPPQLHQDDLVALRDNFIAMSRGGDAPRYYMSLTRWVVGHLGIENYDLLLTSTHMVNTSVTLKQRLSEASL